MVWSAPSAYSGTKTPGITTFESLTSTQQDINAALVKALQDLFKGTVGGGAKGFKAEYAEPFSPYGGAVGGALESALLTALGGEIPSAAFEKGVAAPTRRTFAEETAPVIREEFAGPGTYWGTARAEKVTGEGRRMETGLVEQRARMVEGALTRALQATGPALSAQQTSISLAFQEYARKNPAAADALQAALAYLGIPITAAYSTYQEQ